MPPTRVIRGGGHARCSVGYDQIGLPNDYHEELPRLQQQQLKKLKWKSYKGLIWALRIDHRKISWGLELAIEEIKKALDIHQEEHNKIVQELEDDFRQIEEEAYKRAEVYGKDYGVKIYEDEGENLKFYNQSIVGKSAWIKWAADGKFKKVLIIDYDLENGAHELLHVEEKLYEWLDLNELLPEDVLWENPKEDNHKHMVSQDGIYLYETSQLMEMVEQVLCEPVDPNLLDEALNYLEEQKHLLDTALESITNKIDQLRDGGNNLCPQRTEEELEERGDNGIKGAHNKEAGGRSYDNSAHSMSGDSISD